MSGVDNNYILKNVWVLMSVTFLLVCLVMIIRTEQIKQVATGYLYKNITMGL